LRWTYPVYVVITLTELDRRKKMSAYLTFDDGPIYPNTERVLEILADFEVAATFFMIGQNVEANPALAARVVQEGHAVGNHSYSHPDLTTLNDQAASNEIGLTQRAIWNATGVWPTIMRPPYGSSNQSVDQLIENWDLRKVMWDVDPEDWRAPGIVTLIDRVYDNTWDESVVLLHDGSWQHQTYYALPVILERLLDWGIVFDKLG
jgi:peptidoglycan/xylan/chitin deacetylase (PgdA/CDA1 family)